MSILRNASLFSEHPKWKEHSVHPVPVDIGFATCEFSDHGRPNHPNTNWGKFYRDNFPDSPFYPGQFLDRTIEILNELGIKKFRFSISRDRLEPKLGHFDESAKNHYRNICRTLKRHGIEPMVTLHHFSDPDYFSWERKEDIEGMVRYAEVAAEFLYEEGVRKLITINEPNILAFQGWILGSFPPYYKANYKGFALVLEHMMQAHFLIYRALKKRHPDFEIGLSYDPLRFRPYHKIHPLWSIPEKIICYYLKEMGHSALFRFFQTGVFQLKIPFLVNHQFETLCPLDFIGLQYYSDPLIRLSFKGLKSVSENPLERLSSYKYRTYPQGLASLLVEFQSLHLPIELTEIGIDTGINQDETDRERIRYFDRIFQEVEAAIDAGILVRSLYFWTLIDNLEWHKAWSIRFGFYSFDPMTAEITPRAVSRWLKERLLSWRGLKEE